MRRTFGLLTAMVLVGVACGDASVQPPSTSATTTTVVAETATTTTVANPVTSTASTLITADLGLTRPDVDCSEENLEGGDDLEFLAAHHVVDGRLGAVCFGEESDTLYGAWTLLSIITPPGQLSDLGLFAGFDSSGDGGEFFAYVVDVDFSGEAFLMAVNLDEADFDRDELALTMAHEFSHVFTALPSQLDRDVFGIDCDTYFNGDGCYLEDSLMWEWIQTFWGDLIDEIDPFADPLVEDASQRCFDNPGFLGPYAATNPEEDFAEAFSAFVFQVPPYDDAVLLAKMEWFVSQPGLLEFQERAEAAGLTVERGLNFEQCGLGG